MFVILIVLALIAPSGGDYTMYQIISFCFLSSGWLAVVDIAEAIKKKK